MGVPGLWSQLDDAGYDIPLNLLALQSFNNNLSDPESSSKHPKRALVVGIDASIWFFHAAQRGKQILFTHKEAGKKSESDLTLLPLKILFYRLAMLLSLPIHLLFVCDGPGRPVHKRGKNIVTDGFSALQRDFLKLVDSFGYRYRVAPGEAEAELAYLNQIGVVDVVMSDDVDTLLFGAKTVILNWSPSTTANKARRRRQRESDSEKGSDSELSSKDDSNSTKTQRSKFKETQGDKKLSQKELKQRKEAWITVYDSKEIEENLDVYLDKEGLILIALLSKGDYTTGIQGCGIKTAVTLAKAGFGKELVEAYKKYCSRIPPPIFQLVSNEENVTKSSRPTSSLKHLFKAYPVPRKLSQNLTNEWNFFLKDWIERVQHELITDSKGFFKERDQNKQPKLANNPGLINFLSTSKEIDALDSYIYPIVSKDVDKEIYEKANAFDGRTTTEDSGDGLGLKFGDEIKWKEPDPKLIAKNAQEAFGWDKEKVMNKMRTLVWKGMIVRQLRREAMKKDRGEKSENSKLNESLILSTPKDSRISNDFISPVTPGSTSSSILSEVSPLSSVSTPSGSQSYLKDKSKSVEVPFNQREAQKFAHQNNLGYLLACHSSRRIEDVGFVKEYRLEIDPTGFVKRAEMELVDEVEGLGEEQQNEPSGDEGEGGEKVKKSYEPPLKPVRLWISSDLLEFDPRGKNLKKEFDEKTKQKKNEKELKEARKKIGITSKGGKKKSSKSLQKGKNRGNLGFTDDDDSDDVIFSSDDDEEDDNDDDQGDVTLKATNPSSNKFKSNSKARESTPPMRQNSLNRPSSNALLKNVSKKKKDDQAVTLLDSDEEEVSKKKSSSKEKSKSQPKSSIQNGTKDSSSKKSASLSTMNSKKTASNSFFKNSKTTLNDDGEDDGDDADETLPDAFNLIRRTSQPNNTNSKIRNRMPSSQRSSESSNLEKSPRKKEKLNILDQKRNKGKEKEKSNTNMNTNSRIQSKSDIEIEDGDESLILISNPNKTKSSLLSSSKSGGASSSSIKSKTQNLSPTSREEPIVLSD